VRTVEVAHKPTVDELKVRLQKAEEKAEKWQAIAKGLYEYYYLSSGISTSVRAYEDAAND
jgi:predicted ribosome quality control (RQC) complex YloA/Tae2 family protein